MSKIGRDRYGIFPLKGKLINAKTAAAVKISENKEITELKKIIGLRQGMIFNTKDDLKQLRYGGIVILTDQDTDGSHIKGLVFKLGSYLLAIFVGNWVLHFISNSDYQSI